MPRHCLVHEMEGMRCKLCGKTARSIALDNQRKLAMSRPKEKPIPSIWKFDLKHRNGRTSIPMPRDAELLSVQMQSDKLCLWACIPNVDATPQTRNFLIIGTGLPIVLDASETKHYIGTAQEGFNVSHVFEITRD